MGILIDALATAGLVALVIWAISLYKSAVADKKAVDEARTRERREAELDAALHRPGELLRCMNCDAVFAGPLPDTGCPSCHLSTLVVPEFEFQRTHRTVDNQQSS